MSYDGILLTEQDGAATIRFNRPAVLNAFDIATLSEFIDALDRVRDEGRARALLITGAGRAFCSGAQLIPGKGPAGADSPAALLDTYFNPIVERLRAMPVPVVCAVNGPAAGGGCGFALMGDIVIAARSAFFLQPFASIGLVPDTGATWLLPRLIGRARATAMMMLGERVSAETAHQWGMIHQVVDDDALASTAGALVARLAQGPTRAYALMREAVWAGLESSFAQSLRLESANQDIAGATADHTEGVAAFLEKRTPTFTGR